MKANMLKGVLATASVVLAVASASSALAGSRNGVSAKTLTPAQSLGAGASATDLWVATCPAGKTGLSADVLDRISINNAAARMGVTIVKDNGAITATSAGEDSVGGPVTLSKGAGAYTATFHKTNSGSEDYDSIVRCQPGATDPTSLLRIQNQ